MLKKCVIKKKYKPCLKGKCSKDEKSDHAEKYKSKIKREINEYPEKQMALKEK